MQYSFHFLIVVRRTVRNYAHTKLEIATTYDAEMRKSVRRLTTGLDKRYSKKYTISLMYALFRTFLRFVNHTKQ